MNEYKIKTSKLKKNEWWINQSNQIKSKLFRENLENVADLENVNAKIV